MSYIEDLSWEDAEDLLRPLAEAEAAGANTAITVSSFMGHLREKVRTGRQADEIRQKQIETLQRHVIEGMQLADYGSQIKKLPFEHIALDVAVYLLSVFKMEFAKADGGPAFGEVVTDSDDYK